MRSIKLISMSAVVLLLAACGGGSSGGGVEPQNTTTTVTQPNPPTTLAAESSDMTLVSPVAREDGAGPVTVTFSVFLPERLEGETRPLILHSHGYGASRIGTTEAAADPAEPASIDSTDSVFSRIDNQVRLLWDAGYIVVSFDERGFGRGDDGDDGNSGAIQLMDPAYEIQDAIAVLDWADANIENIARDAGGNMIAGSIGGSYGGGYQLLLTALDNRLDAITPTATWFNLLQSLLPNDVIKKAYATGLCATGTNDRAENGRRARNACSQASDTGAPNARYKEDIPENVPANGNRAELISSFFTHGLVEFDRREKVGQYDMRPVDALLIQGNRDILFNLNQSAENYRYLSEAGGDVRLLTMENGHSIRETRSNGGSQGPLGPSACGTYDSLAAIRAWFDLKLRGISSAATRIPPEVCISLNDTAGVLLNEYPTASSSNAQFDGFTMNVPSTSLTAQQTNMQSATGQAIFIEGPTIIGNNQVLAGTPVALLTVEDADALAAQNGGATAFVGIGVKRGNTTILVDDQVQAMRSTDDRTGAAATDFPLVGIGEPLQDGDIVGVLLYGHFDQYDTGTGAPANYSANNRLTVSGTVRLPIVTGTVVAR